MAARLWRLLEPQRFRLHGQGSIVDLAIRQTGNAFDRTDIEARWMNPEAGREVAHRFGEYGGALFGVNDDAVPLVYRRYGSGGREQFLHVVQTDAPSE